MSFIQHFFEDQGIIITPGENQVLCPFPHAVSNGVEYSETRPSAHYNPTKGVYHCKACGRGYNEIQFIEQHFGCDRIIATKLADCFKASKETLIKWDSHDDEDGLIDLEEPLNEETKARAQALGISDKAIRLMHMKTKSTVQSGWSNIMVFPIDIYGVILEHKYYHPYDADHPKTATSKKFWSRGGCPTGLVYPWRILENCGEKSILCICAGEKDTANMLENGFQAVTVHGGEQTYKIVCPNMFKNKSVAILYDNDDAGITGARKLATFLHEKGCQRIRVVTGHHDVCVEEHEDITDWFLKYGKSAEELKDIIRNTPLFEPEKEDREAINAKPVLVAREELPTITLYASTHPDYEGKLVRSLVQVVASEDAAYSVPKKLVVRKVKEATKPEDHHWSVGQYKEWELTAENSEDILHLVEGNFTSDDIIKHIKTKLIHVDPKEPGLVVDIQERGVAYRATVQDYIEDKSIEFKSQPFDALVFDTKMDSGKKYLITYKITPHDYKGARKTMIVSEVEDAEDSVNRFDVTPEVIESLIQFQGKSTDQIVQSFAPYIGFTPNLQLLKTIDFAFHTPLQFYLTNQFNKPQLLRGTLDTLIVGESRIGKLQFLYNKCLTPCGWKLFKDLRVGDLVINGTTGQPEPIIEIKEWDNNDRYRITFTDGTYTDCHYNHEWTLRNIKQNNKRKHRDAHLPPYEITLELNQIMQRNYNDYYLPPLPKINFPEKEYLIDPYLLGTLIGDGATEKFIPEEYKWGSYEQRYALWEGLIDTDGCRNRGNRLSYSTSSKQLAYDMQQLSLSLGMKAAVNGPCRDTEYVVQIHPHSNRFIRSIEKLKGTAPGRCISITDPQGLYITDDFIITHNSATTKTAIEVYGLGQIVSLAGKSATINGLIGGSMKVGASDRYATKAGVLPMNHKGLVILEELGKATADLMRELTDIRSSNRVRITRVDNTVDLPCMLRMIYLTNPKSRDGETQSVESFPHGIEIVTGLVSAPEDIARFDNICIIGDKASVDYTKMEEATEEYSIKAYRDRIRWIWSRKPEQIIITKEADMLLRQLCNKLNGIYETHIKIFGTELRQKIARIAVAIAGYRVSTDSTFETIQVLPAHVDEAATYFKDLYDNSTFKILRYVNDQKQYSEVTPDGIATLEAVFNKKNGAPLVYALDQRSVCTLNELMASTGTTRDDLNMLLQPLLKACMIQFSDQNKIRPTEKYRLTRPQINVKRVRELSDERRDNI